MADVESQSQTRFKHTRLHVAHDDDRSSSQKPGITHSLTSLSYNSALSYSSQVTEKLSRGEWNKMAPLTCSATPKLANQH